jgi:hypothetical protein
MELPTANSCYGGHKFNEPEKRKTAVKFLMKRKT